MSLDKIEVLNYRSNDTYKHFGMDRRAENHESSFLINTRDRGYVSMILLTHKDKELY